MDNDDALIGRLLTRREVLALFGAVGVTLAAGCTGESSPRPTPAANTPGTTTTPASGATPSASLAAASTATTAAAAEVPSCVVVPALTEGPYFVDEKLNRSDIRTDPVDGTTKAGTPLELVLQVSAIGAGCTPLAGALVDVWQCDALGVYSDAQDPGFNTRGKKFLRGYQVTDSAGQAKFTTIYPGWYQGRTVHIHFKVRTQRANGQAYDFTSQWFFDDTLSDEVFKQAPYAAKGNRTTRNSNDGIFRQSGDQLVLKPAKGGDGYTATFPIGLQLG
ncbi:MAG: intradiol ring-cleavage dioxygenase [Chloroflexi bacterium]|nr:intradiol ring-cleavage dioxygenase [Chloroflexota bacterium]